MDPKACGHRDPTTKSRDCTEPRWKVGATYCGKHEAEYRKNRSRNQAGAPARPRRTRVKFARLGEPELASEAEAALSHEYVADPELLKLWQAVTEGAAKHPAANLLFLGPSGSGKTLGAQYLASLVDLPFVKVDAASMTDPEAWFGTREITVEEGKAVTSYRPSTFVEWLQKPCVLLIDEANRVRDEHRNVLIPVLDHTRAVLNPLDGQVVKRHPLCFIIMSGNVGVAYTGTSAMDPAFLKRSLTVEFDYIGPKDEARVVKEATGCDDETAEVLVYFAGKTRARARGDSEFMAFTTRELLEAGRLVADGLSRDLAVKFTVLNATSGEGGDSSVRNELQALWTGARAYKAAVSQDGAGVGWVCPTHGVYKTVLAGTSAKTGKPYAAFRACAEKTCGLTEGFPVNAVNSGPKTCSSCGTLQPTGRMTFCVSCGAAI